MSDGWQPIETAPMDGTVVILGYLRGLVMPGVWLGESGWIFGCTGWLAFNNQLGVNWVVEPDRWMSFPEPPVTP